VSDFLLHVKRRMLQFEQTHTMCLTTTALSYVKVYVNFIRFLLVTLLVIISKTLTQEEACVVPTGRLL